jgi:hypothetical protein
MDDETVRLPRPGATPPAKLGPAGAAPPAKKPPAKASLRRMLLIAGAAIATLGAGAGAGWWYYASCCAGPIVHATPPRPVAMPVPVRPAGPPLMSEAEILNFHPREPSVIRLRQEPRIFVLVFPDLESQGAALNRVAALIEKRGLPRDRVLNDAELAAAIRSAGHTPATYYFGHNYRGTDLARFFDLADRQGIALNAGERWVREQMVSLPGFGVPVGDTAFISVPGLDARVDETTRRAILHHEIGHGHFFTNVVFAAHIRRVWRNDFTAADRAAFIRFLAASDYDPEQEEIMVNETMAYLLFTPDERIFSARDVNMSPERLQQLRALMLNAAPPLAGNALQ